MTKAEISKEFFGSHEFDCRCGCGLGLEHMDYEFLLMLVTARRLAGVPFVLTSAIRCVTHNRNEGGKRNSAHLGGLAVDIECTHSRERFLIVRALIMAGFKRIGVADNFIHVDMGADILPTDVMWVY